eukprot:Nk52_evm68s151 gene=Nk52_evmTU68s151
MPSLTSWIWGGETIPTPDSTKSQPPPEGDGDKGGTSSASGRTMPASYVSESEEIVKLWEGLKGDLIAKLEKNKEGGGGEGKGPEGQGHLPAGMSKSVSPSGSVMEVEFVEREKRTIASFFSRDGGQKGDDKSVKDTEKRDHEAAGSVEGDPSYVTAREEIRKEFAKRRGNISPYGTAGQSENTISQEEGGGSESEDNKDGRRYKYVDPIEMDHDAVKQLNALQREEREAVKTEALARCSEKRYLYGKCLYEMPYLSWERLNPARCDSKRQQWLRCMKAEMGEFYVFED